MSENLLTVVDRGGVKHPEILTVDEAQNLLDQYGTGGTAIKIPNGVNLQKFLGRCTGGFYYDNAALSGTTGGPIKDMVYYTVINGGIPGNRAIVASSHGNNLWIAEVYGDVFRGWITFSRPQDVTNEINTAIANHEASRNHPYALETAPGFVELADATEGISGTDATRAMTSVRTQGLLDTYGIGKVSVPIPRNVDLVAYLKSQKCGFFHLDASAGFGYTNIPTDSAFSWGEIILTAHEVSNYRSITLLTAEGHLYTAAISAGAFSGWKRRIELADIPLASASVSGLTKVLDSISSGDQVNAGSANAVRVAYETAVNANNNANGRVPAGRRINGYALTGDVNLSANDVGAYTKAEVNALLGNSSTDLRLGAPQTIKERRATERLSGGVMTSWADYGGSNYWVVLRPLQIYRNGVWTLVPYTNA